MRHAFATCRHAGNVGRTSRKPLSGLLVALMAECMLAGDAALIDVDDEPGAGLLIVD
jgi:hypothetical protein